MTNGCRHIVYTKADDNYDNIAEFVETIFHTSNYELDIPSPTEKNKNVIELIIGKFGGKIITESAVLRPKTYSYLMELLKFEHDKNCSEPTQLKNKMNHLEKKRIEIMQSWIK